MDGGKSKLQTLPARLARRFREEGGPRTLPANRRRPVVALCEEGGAAEASQTSGRETSGEVESGELQQPSPLLGVDALRGIEFEDYSRCSGWEQLQFELSKALSRLDGDLRELRGLSLFQRSARRPRHWGGGFVLEAPEGCSCAERKGEEEETAERLSRVCSLAVETHSAIVGGEDCSSWGTFFPRLRLSLVRRPSLPDVCFCGGEKGDSEERLPDFVASFFERHGVPKPWLQTLAAAKREEVPSAFDRRCRTCANCVLRWEGLFPSRASFLQRQFGPTKWIQAEAVRPSEASLGGASLSPRSLSCDAIPLELKDADARSLLAALRLAVLDACNRRPTVGRPSSSRGSSQLSPTIPLFVVKDPLRREAIGFAVTHTERCRGSADLFPSRRRSAIRQYKSEKLSSVPADLDLSDCLLMALCEMGGLSWRDGKHTLNAAAPRLLENLLCAVQFTYFLPSPWPPAPPHLPRIHEVKAKREDAGELWIALQRLAESGGGSSKRARHSVFEFADAMWTCPLHWLRRSSATRRLVFEFDCRLRLVQSPSAARLQQKLVGLQKRLCNSEWRSDAFSSGGDADGCWRHLQFFNSREAAKATPVAFDIFRLAKTARLVAMAAGKKQQTPGSAEEGASLWTKQPLLNADFAGFPEETPQPRASANSSDSSESEPDSSESEAESLLNLWKAEDSGRKDEFFDESPTAPLSSIQARVLFRQAKRVLLSQSFFGEESASATKTLSSQCKCCAGADGERGGYGWGCCCCGLDLAFALSFGTCDGESFSARLAKHLASQRNAAALQKAWQKALSSLRRHWNEERLLVGVVGGSASWSLLGARRTRRRGAVLSPAAMGRGVSAIPDGPAGLPDVCASALQQWICQLNCAIQQRRIDRILTGGLNEEDPAMPTVPPIEALRFAEFSSFGKLASAREPLLPVFSPVTAATLHLHEALLERRSQTKGLHPRDVRLCFAADNPGDGLAEREAFWTKINFGDLPTQEDRLLQLSKALRSLRSETLTAAAGEVPKPEKETAPRRFLSAAAAVSTARRLAEALRRRVEDEGREATRCSASSSSLPAKAAFSAEVEAEMALQGLEGLTTSEVLFEIIHLLVAAAADRSRLCCACLLQGSPVCRYVSLVVVADADADAASGAGGDPRIRVCRNGARFPCHLPAVQSAADALQRTAVQLAAQVFQRRRSASCAMQGGCEESSAECLSEASLEEFAKLLSAVAVCEISQSAAKALVDWLGAAPPGLALANRCLSQLLFRLQTAEEDSVAADASAGEAALAVEEEGDVLVPLLSCAEKLHLSRVLHNNGRLGDGEDTPPPIDEETQELPWPPFASEFIFLRPTERAGEAESSRQELRFGEGLGDAVWRVYGSAELRSATLGFSRESELGLDGSDSL